MKIVEEYKQWKLDNPDEGYQYDEIREFLANYDRGDLQSLLEFAEELQVKADKWDALDKTSNNFIKTIANNIGIK